MTTVASPKDLIAAHRQRMRQSAALHGAPLARARFRGIHLDPTGYVYLRDKAPVYRSATGRPETIDADRLSELLADESSEKCIVVADRAAFNGLLAVAQAAPASQRRTLVKTLEVIDSLEGSVRMPTLTKALAHRFWLPEGMDETRLDDWCAAFGINAPTPSLRLAGLVEADRSAPAADRAFFGPKVIDNLVRAEASLVDTARWSGIASSCDLFTRLEQHKSLHDGVRTADPGLLEIHAMDGQASRLVVLNVREQVAIASVSDPFKIKPGKVRVTDGRGIAETEMLGLRFAQDTMHAEFRVTKPLAPMFQAAKAGLKPLYVLPAVYSIVAKPRLDRRWMQREAPEKVERSVPLDVIVAGAPTAD